MDVIPLISEHLQRKKSTPNLLSYFCNQCLSNTFHECISLLNILCANFICLFLTKSSMLSIPSFPSPPHSFHWYLSSIRFFLFGLGYILSQTNFQIKSKSFTFFFYISSVPLILASNPVCAIKKLLTLRFYP